MTYDRTPFTALSAPEWNTLQQQYNGPIPASAAHHIIAQRGQPEPPASLSDLEFNLIGARKLIVAQLKQVDRQQMALAHAVADWDVSPEHDKQRCHNVAQSLRRQLQSSNAQLADLIALESSCMDQIEARVTALRDHESNAPSLAAALDGLMGREMKQAAE